MIHCANKKKIEFINRYSKFIEEYLNSLVFRVIDCTKKKCIAVIIILQNNNANPIFLHQSNKSRRSQIINAFMLLYSSRIFKKRKAVTLHLYIHIKVKSTNKNVPHRRRKWMNLYLSCDTEHKKERTNDRQKKNPIFSFSFHSLI